MRGGSQSHMMLASDDKCYVVKFQNNPQGMRVLINELVASRLARLLGLSVPQHVFIDVSPWIIDNTPELSAKYSGHSEPFTAGIQFGSQVAGGLMPSQVVDYLPENELRRVRNIDEFAGMLVFDMWTCNVDGRQAMFVRTSRQKHYSAAFIDQGHCFNGNSWEFEDIPLRGVYPRNAVYEGVIGWQSFNPWLERIEAITDDQFWREMDAIPKAWSGQKQDCFVDIVAEELLRRKCKVRDLITAFRNSDRKPFPHWHDAAV